MFSLSLGNVPKEFVNKDLWNDSHGEQEEFFLTFTMGNDPTTCENAIVIEPLMTTVFSNDRILISKVFSSLHFPFNGRISHPACSIQIKMKNTYCQKSGIFKHLSCTNGTYRNAKFICTYLGSTRNYNYTQSFKSIVALTTACLVGRGLPCKTFGSAAVASCDQAERFPACYNMLKMAGPLLLPLLLYKSFLFWYFISTFMQYVMTSCPPIWNASYTGQHSVSEL